MSTDQRTDGTVRPCVEDVFMTLAGQLAERSTCPAGARHGAVLAVSRRVVATGYGSPTSGVPPCSECWLRKSEEATGYKDWSVCPSVHAEENAVAMAARHGISVAGAVAYVTKRPCDRCLRLLKNAGVAECLYAASGHVERLTLYPDVPGMRSPMERGG